MLRNALLLLSICLVSGCGATQQPIRSLAPGESVTGLRFSLAAEHLDKTLTSSQREQIASFVATNLHSWRYPMQIGNSDNLVVSHMLEGRVGQVVHKSTPPGMSLTLGNSDPRALDFQRADVLPITCALRTRHPAEEAITLTGEFAVDKSLGDLFSSKPEALPPAFYIDRIGTVCLNLLTELKINRDSAAISPSAPIWIPEIRVEIKDKDEDDTHPSAIPDHPSTDASQQGGVSNVPASVHAETRTKDSDSRKQMIIQNRGTPVILEFGYERK